MVDEMFEFRRIGIVLLILLILLVLLVLLLYCIDLIEEDKDDVVLLLERLRCSIDDLFCKCSTPDNRRHRSLSQAMLVALGPVGSLEYKFRYLFCQYVKSFVIPVGENKEEEEPEDDDDERLRRYVFCASFGTPSNSVNAFMSWSPSASLCLRNSCNDTSSSELEISIAFAFAFARRCFFLFLRFFLFFSLRSFLASFFAFLLAFFRFLRAFLLFSCLIDSISSSSSSSLSEANPIKSLHPANFLLSSL